jgi:hypothetical protein
MSKSLARVVEALRAGGHNAAPLEMPGDTRTAEQAAMAAGCALNQIVKSILFQGASGRLYLFLTPGGQQVDAARASLLAGEPLGRADAGTVAPRATFSQSPPAPCSGWPGRNWPRSRRYPRQTPKNFFRANRGLRFAALRYVNFIYIPS